MSILGIISLIIAGLQSVLSVVTKNPVYSQITGDVQGALKSLTSVQNQIVTLAELEDLRTKKLW